MKKYLFLSTEMSASDIEAAKRSEAVTPDETRAILYGRWSRRNRYAHGPVSTWIDDGVAS